jgi:hypothetical protein
VAARRCDKAAGGVKGGDLPVGDGVDVVGGGGGDGHVIETMSGMATRKTMNVGRVLPLSCDRYRDGVLFKMGILESIQIIENHLD